MRSLACVLLIALVATASAQAQTPGDLQIRLQAYTVSRDGGEKALGLWYGTGPVVSASRARRRFRSRAPARPSP